MKIGMSKAGLEKSAARSTGSNRFSCREVPFHSHLLDGQGLRQVVWCLLESLHLWFPLANQLRTRAVDERDIFFSTRHRRHQPAFSIAPTDREPGSGQLRQGQAKCESCLSEGQAEFKIFPSPQTLGGAVISS